ncbi:hypothetical protein F4802DRAFT_494220 [Xylaria palmicola]|nr:hypothetical protein F4802DRAFT_494220 [Xylaria palmicola]
MSSPFPTPKPYSLQLAERIHYSTGKEHLVRICVGGFLLESSWHAGVERRILKTPAPAVNKALFRAAATWPIIYIATSAAINWAAWRVNQAPGAERDKNKRDA